MRWGGKEAVREGEREREQKKGRKEGRGQPLFAVLAPLSHHAWRRGGDGRVIHIQAGVGVLGGLAAVSPRRAARAGLLPFH